MQRLSSSAEGEGCARTPPLRCPRRAGAAEGTWPDPGLPRTPELGAGAFALSTYCSQSVCNLAGWGSVHGAKVENPGWKVSGDMLCSVLLVFLSLFTLFPFLFPRSSSLRSWVRVSS